MSGNPDLLAHICAAKREHIARRQKALPWPALIERAKGAASPRGFAAALEQAVAVRGCGVITEIKKASPSAGLIRPDFDPPALARAYAAGGGACLSILTDGPYFQGADVFVTDVRAVVELPILRKDFMLDPYQVVETRAIGADAILLILAALSDEMAAELEAAAEEFGLDVLVEVHDEAELERALRLSTPLIGINNRNLKTLAVDLAVTERLAVLAPADRALVAESGISRPADLARLIKAGARRFLIGESLMRQADVSAATRALLEAVDS